MRYCVQPSPDRCTQYSILSDPIHLDVVTQRAAAGKPGALVLRPRKGVESGAPEGLQSGSVDRIESRGGVLFLDVLGMPHMA